MPAVYETNFTFQHQPGQAPQFWPQLNSAGLNLMDTAANKGAVSGFQFSGGNGTVVDVVAPVPPAGGSVSETIYATLPPGFLVAGKTYSAELSFDLPNVPNTTAVAQPTWTVTLNFKTGDVTDKTSDQIAGVSCQFSGAGQVKLHFVSNPGAIPQTIYQEFNYNQNNPIRFNVSIQIYEGAGGLVAGTGALSFGTTAIPPSSLKPISPATALPIFSDVKVVGVALVTTTGGTYTARLRSFMVSVD